jgi:hypothetical protein
MAEFKKGKVLICCNRQMCFAHVHKSMFSYDSERKSGKSEVSGGGGAGDHYDS